MSGLFAIIRNSLGLASPASRKVAKERLSIMLVQQRNSELFASIDISALQKEVAMVLRKHIKVAENRPAQMSVRQEGDMDFLELHFPLEADIIQRKPSH